MPSLEIYGRLNGFKKTNGDVRKYQSDVIMDQTWGEDIGAQVAYFYDYLHDDEPERNFDLHPENSATKTPVDIKYVVSSYQTLDKDDVPFHIQFRPGYKCTVPYYDTEFGRRYKATFPIGLFVDIRDESGVYCRWLVVGNANKYNIQFPTYNILPCTDRLCWIYGNKQYKSWGAPRSQNSYVCALHMRKCMSKIL